MELRNPDPSCNPYLALAVCLAAGLDGMEKGLTPPEEITENIFEMDADERAACGIEDLPDSLEHALVALEADPLMAQVLGLTSSPSMWPARKRSGRNTAPASPAGRLPNTWCSIEPTCQTGRNPPRFPRFFMAL